MPQGEVDAEISKTLSAEKVTFDWKKDKSAYEKWVKGRTNIPAQAFGEEIRHFLQIDKLRARVMESVKLQATEGEARQKFLNENNSLSVELVQCATQIEADEFYKKVKGRVSLWEKEKQKRPQDFKRPGFVSLEFLIDLWKIPEDACYAMMQAKAGDMYPPRPIYKGYAVFRVLEKKPADQSGFAAARESYLEKVRNIKKIQGFSSWFDNLKKQAHLKVYLPAQAGATGKQSKKEE